jgi:hypothetical protein
VVRVTLAVTLSKKDEEGEQNEIFFLTCRKTSISEQEMVGLVHENAMQGRLAADRPANRRAQSGRIVEEQHNQTIRQAGQPEGISAFSALSALSV